MKLDRAKLPIRIFLLIVLFLGIKLLFNGSRTLHPNDDGTVSYKKSGEGDDYLFKITDTVAFQAHLLPTMSAISMSVTTYKKVGFVEGLFLGKNKANRELFTPYDIKGDWVYSSYAKKGDYFAVNTKTGELLKNETGSDTLYETEYYKSKFEGGKSLDDVYVLKNFEPLSTYKSSGEAMVWAGILLGAVCLIWFIIAAIIDKVKPRNTKPTTPVFPVEGRRPEA